MRNPETPSTPRSEDQPKSCVASKVCSEHVERLAIVYVRQSSPHQVANHKESLARQYGFRDYVAGLGWHEERILVIDDDLGLSGRTAENRPGFQRLLAEVTMGHVGIVAGLEMSRLARSSKDWHQLFELCGIFGTLLADEDGVYDPNDSNDRFLLGLKGIVSEVEIHIMRNRLERGKLNKAKRGELFLHAPVGYVKRGNCELAFDPDEQVREVVRLIFDKFAELGTIHAVFRYLRHHDIQLGIRPISGPNRGNVEWRTPHLGTIAAILRNPTYAGVFAYGRFPVDRKHPRPNAKRRIRLAPMKDWQVIVRDKFPGYITWEQYLQNREHMEQNRTTRTTRGSARGGGAMLAGIVHCTKCGGRMIVRYNKDHQPRYECQRNVLLAEGGSCCGLAAGALDRLLEQEVLRVVEPGAIDLSIRALSDLQGERERLDRHWQRNLERARYEADKAERHYRAVDPENRLVARTLEQQWEATLRKERALKEDHERFQRESPRVLTTSETDLVRALATNLPEVWNAPTTRAIDKQEVVRCLVERVSVNVPNNDENVDVTITWAGGETTCHHVRRPVQNYRQLHDFAKLREVIASGREAGLTNAEIAEQLNDGGFVPPSTRASRFTRGLVAQLVCRIGLATPRDGQGILAKDEWWLRDLAQELGIGPSRVRGWIKKGFVQFRKVSGGKYVVWADKKERAHLMQRRVPAQRSEFRPEHAKGPLSCSVGTVTATNTDAIRTDRR